MPSSWQGFLLTSFYKVLSLLYYYVSFSVRFFWKYCIRTSKITCFVPGSLILYVLRSIYIFTGVIHSRLFITLPCVFFFFLIVGANAECLDVAVPSSKWSGITNVCDGIFTHVHYVRMDVWNTMVLRKYWFWNGCLSLLVFNIRWQRSRRLFSWWIDDAMVSDIHFVFCFSLVVRKWVNDKAPEII